MGGVCGPGATVEFRLSRIWVAIVSINKQDLVDTQFSQIERDWGHLRFVWGLWRKFIFERKNVGLSWIWKLVFPINLAYQTYLFQYHSLPSLSRPACRCRCALGRCGPASWRLASLLQNHQTQIKHQPYYLSISTITLISTTFVYIASIKFTPAQRIPIKWPLSKLISVRFRINAGNYYWRMSKSQVINLGGSQNSINKWYCMILPYKWYHHVPSQLVKQGYINHY